MEQDHQFVVGRPFRLGITGHRPYKLSGYDDISNLSAPLKLKMELFFKEKSVTTLVSGMAQGVDQWAVEVALNLGIKVKALIPCINQEKLWPFLSQARYYNLLTMIEEHKGSVIYVSQEEYQKGCMHRRNLGIVNSSDELLAIWDGTKGGTQDCVRIASREGVLVTILNPYSMEFSRHEVANTTSHVE